MLNGVIYGGASKRSERKRSAMGKLIYPSQKIWQSKTWYSRDRTPTDRRPSPPQAYQCLLSQFLATLGAQEKTDCTSML